MGSSYQALRKGFIVLVGLLSLLLLVAVWQLHRIQNNLEQITNEHMYRMSLAWEIRHAARERILLLHQLVLTEDPFERDTLNQTGTQYATNFLQAREALLSSQLSTEQESILNQSFAYTNLGWQAYLEILAAAEMDELAKAREILRNSVLPSQERALGYLDQFVSELQAKVAEAKHLSQLAYHTALFILLLIGVLFVVFGALMSARVLRRTRFIEQVLKEERDRSESTLSVISDAAIYTDKHSKINLINPAALHLLGLSRQEALGMSLEKVLHVASEAGRQLLYPIPQDECPSLWHHPELIWHEPGLLLSNKDELRHVEFSITAIRDLNEISAYVVLIRDISEAYQLNQQLNWAASHDPLTGLYNRYEFEKRLQQMLTESLHRQHVIMYMDLDQFKVVNDTCGHLAGDELLQQVAALMIEFVREQDMLARLGGDEFGILLRDCPLSEAKLIAQRLLDAIHDYRFGWHKRNFIIGVSIGISAIDGKTETAQQLLSHVDAACYIAKESGRNRIHVYDESDVHVKGRTNQMVWSQRITDAISQNQFTLYSQGIADVADISQMQHMEILLRMLDENGRFIPPSQFIPAAERFGLMPDLDRWVIENTFRHLANCPPGLPCRNYAINLSGQTLSNKKVLRDIIDMMDEMNISPERICFEVTETFAVSNLNAAKNFINILRGIGCKFSLDDFGSGMASFGYLRQLKVDYLKIDGSFVRNICHDATDRAIVESIQKIGSEMEISTIAEWVENEETIALLRRIGIDYVQGYGVHVPAPLAQSLCSECGFMSPSSDIITQPI